MESVRIPCCVNTYKIDDVKQANEDNGVNDLILICIWAEQGIIYGHCN